MKRNKYYSRREFMATAGAVGIGMALSSSIYGCDLKKESKDVALSDNYELFPFRIGENILKPNTTGFVFKDNADKPIVMISKVSFVVPSSNLVRTTIEYASLCDEGIRPKIAVALFDEHTKLVGNTEISCPPTPRPIFLGYRLSRMSTIQLDIAVSSSECIKEFGVLAMVQEV